MPKPQYLFFVTTKYLIFQNHKIIFSRKPQKHIFYQMVKINVPAKTTQLHFFDKTTKLFSCQNHKNIFSVSCKITFFPNPQNTFSAEIEKLQFLPKLKNHIFTLEIENHFFAQTIKKNIFSPNCKITFSVKL